MQLKPGDFIFHSERGVGRIQAVVSEDPQEILLAFQGKEPETLPGYLLERDGAKISPLGFRALAYCDPEAAARLLREDPVEAVCLVLEDYPGHKAKTEDLKDYLAPHIEDWEKWWDTAQPLLKENPRIDSSKSRLREYGLHHELQTRSDEAYRAYRRIKPFEDPPIVYAQARRALTEHFEGTKLAEDPLDDLLAYFNQAIASSEMPISLRFDALFRLEEWKAISPVDFKSTLRTLSKLPVSLAKMDAYPLNRLADYLLKRPLQPESLDLLASGIKAGEQIAKRLVEWAERSGQPEISTKFLLQALSEELPHDKNQIDVPALSRQIDLATRLLRSIPKSSPQIPNIIEAFQRLCRVIVQTEKVGTDRYLTASLINFAQALYQLTEKGQPNLSEDVLASLVGPDLTVGFIVMILDIAVRSNMPLKFQADLEQYFLNTIDRRKDDFLSPLVSARWTNERERIIELVKLASNMKGAALVERSGRLVCELLQNLQEKDWVDLLPYLIQLVNLPEDWTWKSNLSAFLEKAYLSLMLNPLANLDQKQFHEQAVVQAAQEFANLQSENLKIQIDWQENRLKDLQEKIASLEKQLSDKDTLVRELRSGVGGGTTLARFEERSRILKELVSTIAEFERYAVKQPTHSKEIEAVLRRLENLAASYKMVAQEPIGTQVGFTPQRHRLVEGGNLSPGEPVVVVERGFLIRDPQDRLRLLKPALVKKP